MGERGLYRGFDPRAHTLLSRRKSSSPGYSTPPSNEPQHGTLPERLFEVELSWITLPVGEKGARKGSHGQQGEGGGAFGVRERKRGLQWARLGRPVVAATTGDDAPGRLGPPPDALTIERSGSGSAVALTPINRAVALARAATQGGAH